MVTLSCALCGIFGYYVKLENKLLPCLIKDMCLDQMFALQPVLLMKKRVANHNMIDFCVKAHLCL